jgi:uncharacterized protein YraI
VPESESAHLSLRFPEKVVVEARILDLSNQKGYPMKYTNVLCALVAALAAAPTMSHAQQQAYVLKQANLRAGPSRDYPVVAVLGAGVSVWVEGCLDDYLWCDVTVGAERGWMYAGNINYPYQGGRVPLISYGAVIGIGIIGFSLGDYWDNHYRMRPWYPQREHWMDRPVPRMRPGQDHIRPIPIPLPRSHVGPDVVQRPPQHQPHVDGQPPRRHSPSDVPRQPQGQPPAGALHAPHEQPPREAQRPPQDRPHGGERLLKEEPRGGDRR